MKYNLLGSTGLKVSELCLGTMTFGQSETMFAQIGNLDQAATDSLIKRSFDAGINFLDTADVYSNGNSESTIGKSIRNLEISREKLVLATKVYGKMSDHPNDVGASRGHIIDSIHKSLQRLQTDYVDLYQIHGFDILTPMEETLRALDDLVSQGKVRYIGVSNWAAWQIAKAAGICESQRFAKIASLQAYYTVAGRDIEREIVPLLSCEKVGLLVWSPLAGGLLSGKFDRHTEGPAGSRRSFFDFPPVVKERAFDCIDAMKEIASDKDCTVAQIALAWLLAQKHVTSVILGAKTPAQLEDNLQATQLKLSEEEMAILQKVSQLPPEYPGWMLERQSSYRS